jgi:hypothetical protein
MTVAYFVPCTAFNSVPTIAFTTAAVFGFVGSQATSADDASIYQSQPQAGAVDVAVANSAGTIDLERD